MSFEDIDIKLIYDTSSSNIVDDIIVPLLSNATEYYRGVGYFSSAWLGLALKGIQSFVLNNGKMHLMTSPQLSKDDWNAIENGEKAKSDEIIYHNICKTIDTFDPKSKTDVLNMFSWLIADGFLDIKFVICKNYVGNYHDKIAVFEDEEHNKVCLHGSLNDSLQATYNGECVSVFKSWVAGQDEYLNEHYKSLRELYNGENRYFDVYSIPDALKVELIKYQTPNRPYEIKKPKPKNIHLPSYINSIHEYQNKAIENLISNNWCGIFEMATGTGKTITAIEASRIYIEQKNKAFIIVVVPFQHLVTQWESVFADFGYSQIISCYKGKEKWIPIAKKALKNYNARLQNVVCFITTYRTASDENFLNIVKRVNSNLFLIADECHYIGSSGYSQIMLDNFEARLGLSATPDRWFDDDGTTRLRDFFNKTVFEYDLKTAIENNFLTEYKYYPIVVHLREDEIEEYEDLTRKIGRIIKYNDEIVKGSTAELLLIKRSGIISNAINKKIALVTQLKKQLCNGKIKHTLVYCGKGENKLITKKLADLNVRTHDFVYTVNSQKRDELLAQFNTGDIEALVAIKCLDEGVDVPSTQTAYFLASSSNPREFIQRRGRILRKFTDKKIAYIYDFIVMPQISNYSDDNIKVNKSIIFKELPRFTEFSYNAINKYEAHDILKPYLEHMGMDYLLDKPPHEIYHELYREDYKNFERDDNDE